MEARSPADAHIGLDEVLIYVMASGINFNNVWAALGTPVDVIAERQKMGEPEDFHAGGSDCSGIVWAVGQDVRNVASVMRSSSTAAGGGPTIPGCSREGPDARGEHAHLGLPNQLRQLLSVRSRPGPSVPAQPKRLTWEEAGCFLLCASTAYRMLMGWPPHTVESGDVVLVWGAAGGLGSMALDITRAQGGRAIAVVSDEAKREFCMKHGAVGVINRNDFKHWGLMPDTKDAKAYGEWAKGARAFGKAVWDALGERTSPRIVFEHPGEATLPTSGFLYEQGEVWDVMQVHVPRPSGEQTDRQAVNLAVLSFLFWCDFDGVGETDPTEAALKAEFEARGVPEACPSEDFWSFCESRLSLDTGTRSKSRPLGPRALRSTNAIRDGVPTQ